MKLLLDIGNTRLKWALARDGQLVDSGAIVHDGQPERVIAQLPANEPEAIWISHVMGPSHEQALIDAVRSPFTHAPNFARSQAEWHGLQNAYREPERLGVDRWLAMIAVWRAHQGGACIANAGTALTVDVISDDGQHLGGIIAAGFRTQQRAVLGATRFATRDIAEASSQTLGNDTESCVRQGAVLACLGAIDRTATIAGPSSKCIISGGDAGVLLAHLPEHWIHDPHLVFKGLIALAETD